MTTTETTTTQTTERAAEFDPAKAEAFGQHMMGILSGGMLSLMVDVGHRTGLFAAAANGWATSEQLAARGGLTERYVREWLGAMTAAGIVEYDQASEAFRLPPEHAALLIAPTGVAPLAVTTTILARHVPQIAEAFREGGGVPYAAFGPDFTDAWDAVGRGVFDTMLLSDYVPLAPGLTEALTAGIRVADIACGTGHALIVLARAFPASTFIGYDLDEHAIARARAEAAGAELANVSFEVADVARLAAHARYDVVFVFDAIHDQVEPDTVLTRIAAALVPGGLLFMREPCAADTLAGNLANPMASVMYSASTLHCLTVSLAHGGAGIGTAFSERHARQMLADAGFAAPDVRPAPGSPFDAVYVTRKPG
ncbi:MAG: class I SAM-dependent methyltransferase [Streptosporangiaceae bacterium]